MNTANPHLDWDRFLAQQESTHDPEAEHEAALCDADTFSDWLCGESTETAFRDGHMSRMNLIDRAVDALREDPDNARELNAPELLALALGVTPFKEVRIAAMDELARRYTEEMA